MALFTLSTGGQANEDGSTSFENGGNFTPMPEGTVVLAAITKIGWKKPTDFYPTDSIAVDWEVIEPKEYLGRKVKQSLKVYDIDEKKADKAKNMFAVMDAIAGGKIMKEVAKNGEDPTDALLSGALINKLMMLKLGLFVSAEDKAAGKEGMNWIQKVSARPQGTQPPLGAPANTAAPAPTPSAPAETPAQRQARLRAAAQAKTATEPAAQASDEGDDIPF